MEHVPFIPIGADWRGFFMGKISYDTKKEVIRLYFDKHLGTRKISKQLNIGSTSVERIINLYKQHGESSLIKTKQNKLSETTKLEIINRVKNGESKTSLAYEYDIPHASINYWLKKYNEDGYNIHSDKPKGRPSMKKSEVKNDEIDIKEKTEEINDNTKLNKILKQKDQRILELEAEVEALKKLRALVLQRNEQQTKKKQ